MIFKGMDNSSSKTGYIEKFTPKLETLAKLFSNDESLSVGGDSDQVN